jgi:hypothetical protein
MKVKAMIDYVLEMNHLTKEKPNDRYVDGTLQTGGYRFAVIGRLQQVELTNNRHQSI